MNFIHIDNHSINLALVTRIDWHFLDGKLNGASVCFMNGPSTRFQAAEAAQIQAALKPSQPTPKTPTQTK